MKFGLNWPSGFSGEGLKMLTDHNWIKFLLLDNSIYSGLKSCSDPESFAKGYQTLSLFK